MWSGRRDEFYRHAAGYFLAGYRTLAATGAFEVMDTDIEPIL